MFHLLAYLLLILPARPPVPTCCPALSHPLRDICGVLQLIDRTSHYWSQSLREQLDLARFLRRDLAAAPPVESADLLPPYDICVQICAFGRERLAYIQRRALFAPSRDYSLEMDQTSQVLAFWEAAKEATDQQETIACRRRALERIEYILWLRESR